MDQSESEINEDQQEVWKTYECRTLDFGCRHPGNIVESSSLSSIELPIVTYPIQDSLSTQIENGSLSNMQLEAIRLACDRHQRMLPDGKRAGFFLADSTGVGKGRQIAGIILDNLVRGRKKHVWFSASKDLYLDAMRDFRDIGCMVELIDSVSSLVSRSTPVEEAVVFCTYSELTSQGSKKKTSTRMDELIEWLTKGQTSAEAVDGVLVLDECHRAKNYVNLTKTTDHVISIQQKLPNARVIYSSATGISAIQNMAYLSRMGMWGKGTPFEEFEDFYKIIGLKKSIAVLEMMTMQFKSMGCQVARNVGYQGVEFSTVKVPLTAFHAQLYRELITIWKDMYEDLNKAYKLCAETPNGEERQRLGNDHETAMKLYWGQHQRFMGQLIMFFKIPILVQQVQQDLAKGCCSVIGLQSTGESVVSEMVAGGAATEQARPQMISVCRLILIRFITKYFPVKQFWIRTPTDPQEVPYTPSKIDLARECWLMCKQFPIMDFNMFIPTIQSLLEYPRNVPAYDKEGRVLECVRMKNKWLRRCEETWMPPCALDDLVDQLGGINKVAEMTGRTIRQVRGTDGLIRVENKKSGGGTNVQERTAFTNGSKLVAIISDAASTGISLHADKMCLNQRRRIHSTLELGWSADDTLQQLGRSHRSNQTSAPIFVLLDSGLAGENRFIASVSKRLQTLGALTQADRRASMGVMSFGEFQLDSHYGRKAVKGVYESILAKKLPNTCDWRTIVQEAMPMFLLDAQTQASGREWCTQRTTIPTVRVFFEVLQEALVYVNELKVNMGGGVQPLKTAPSDVARFLNRMLGLPFGHQTLLFQYFQYWLEDTIKESKRQGTYDFGVQTLDGNKIERRGAMEMLYQHPETGGKLILNPISVDRGITFLDAVHELEYRSAVLHRVNAKREEYPLRQELTEEAFHALYSQLDPQEAGFFQSINPINNRVRMCLAIRLTTESWKLIRPGTGISVVNRYPDEMLVRNYKRVTTMEETRKRWMEEYQWSTNECSHGPFCRIGGHCRVGKRILWTNILQGNVMAHWTELQDVMSKTKTLPKYLQTLSIVQTRITNTNERLVGVLIPGEAYSALNQRVAKWTDADDRRLRFTLVVHRLIMRPAEGKFPDEWKRLNDFIESEQVDMTGFAVVDDKLTVTVSTVATVPVGSEIRSIHNTEVRGYSLGRYKRTIAHYIEQNTAMIRLGFLKPKVVVTQTTTGLPRDDVRLVDDIARVRLSTNPKKRTREEE